MTLRHPFDNARGAALRQAQDAALRRHPLPRRDPRADAERAAIGDLSADAVLHALETQGFALVRLDDDATWNAIKREYRPTGGGGWRWPAEKHPRIEMVKAPSEQGD